MASLDVPDLSGVAEQNWCHIALRYDHLYGRGDQEPGSEEIVQALASHSELRLPDMGGGLSDDSNRLMRYLDLTVARRCCSGELAWMVLTVRCSSPMTPAGVPGRP